MSWQNKLADGTIADGKNREKYQYCIYIKKSENDKTSVKVWFQKYSKICVSFTKTINEEI